ncbi:hypothetical protein CVG87_26830 [Pseudomonas sp. WCS365]|nr:hypothetical protein CVG87_26830 [Pseudomonas sp. WCS365]
MRGPESFDGLTDGGADGEVLWRGDLSPLCGSKACPRKEAPRFLKDRSASIAGKPCSHIILLPQGLY